MGPQEEPMPLEDDDDGILLALPEIPADPAPVLPPAAAPTSSLAKHSGPAHIVPQQSLSAAAASSSSAAPAPAPIPMLEGGTGDEPSSEELVVFPPPAAAPAIHRRTLTWIPALFGGDVAYDEYTTSAGKIYRNYKFRCSRHSNCEKKKGAQFCSNFGSIEPLAYLHAWSQVE